MKYDETAIEDVYDGCLYQKLSEGNGFLSNPDNISLLGNTDGVALVRSSRAGVWPIYYVINELPPRERYNCSKLRNDSIKFIELHVMLHAQDLIKNFQGTCTYMYINYVLLSLFFIGYNIIFMIATS